MSVARLLRELKLPRSTVKSHQASGKKLSALEAERMVKVARSKVRATFGRAAELFDDDDNVRSWLKQPLCTLGAKLRCPWAFIRVTS